MKALPLLILTIIALPLMSACDTALTFLAGEPLRGGLALSNWSGNVSSTSSASYRTARTQDEWQQLWQTIGMPAPGALPDGKMAVAVFLGQRFDTGTRVEIRDAEIRRRVGEPEHAVVTYRELTAPDGIATEQGISPWAIRLMDRTVLAPEFKREGE